MYRNKNLYPLTHPQKSIWNTEKFYPNTSIGNVAGTLRIKGSINIDLLERAINLFIKNNDGLRLRIMEKDGLPMQYICEYKQKKINIIDFSKNNNMEDLYKWEEEQSKIPFEILDSNLYEFTIVKVNDQDVGFYIKTHHLISDAWTMTIIGNQVIEYYTTLINEDEILEKQTSYIDYILSEQKYKESKRFENDKKYWYKTFEYMPEITTLKVRKSNNIDTKTKRKTLVTPVKFTKKLRQYCEENMISPYPLFLSALAMYIKRVSSKDDIVFGTPILNRSNKKEKNTVGMFISTAPLRVNIDENMDFKTFSREVSKECISLLKHQKYPYDILLKDIREKYGTINNLYDIVLSYQNTKFNKKQLDKIQTRWHFNGYQTNSLTIHINDRDDEGRLIIDYDFHSDLFYVKEIEFIHSHIISLLWHALDNPVRPIKNIEMLTESEKHKILYDFNDTKAEYPKDKTIHQLFEEQVRRTPDNVALVFEDKKMTYRELNEKANGLARTLRNRGVKPDDIIGIMLFRSFEMMIGILGILKSGGAYLPIDPEYPEDRIQYMLEDSNAKILLTTKDVIIADEFNEIIIDLYDDEVYSDEASNLKNVNNSNDLIYVIYTSGSTGKPKGVMIEHYSVVNRIHWMQKKYPIDELDVIIQKTPYTFDVSVWELFWWSFVGAKLVMLVPRGEKHPDILKDTIHKYGVTTMHFVPSMLNVFLDYISNITDLFKLQTLKKVFASGEALTPGQVNKFNEILFRSHNTYLFNLYGPTEATVDVSYFDCSTGGKHKVIPIGKPIDNIQLYILDKHCNVQPIGIAGELYISGDGLARGYLNKPKLTSEKFVQNPFIPSQKMYKTGDLVRWFAEGDIEYLGRIDQQVKIRGYRIELQEIQHRILQYEYVKEAVVTSRENKQGSKYICAYIVFKKDIDFVALKNYLLKFLPRYMVPSYFVKLDCIPLSHNGKVNIKMLPEPVTSITTNKDFIQPRNEIEEHIISVWKEILEIEQISVKDNFFDLGGDSLNAIKVISKINKGLTFEDLYQNPTIETLARRIDEIKSLNNDLLIRIGDKKNQDVISIICFPYGGGNSIIYKELSDSLNRISSNHSLYSVNLPGHNFSSQKEDFLSIDEASKKIVDEIKSKIKGDIILYGHCVGSALTIQVSKLLESEDKKVLGVCIGGIFPPKFVKYFGKKFDPWKYASDKFVINFLKKIGLSNTMDLKDEDITYIMDAFRYDVKCYYKYFYDWNNQHTKKISAPILNIVGDGDPLTKGYNNKIKRWENVAEDIRLFVFNNANHYFIKSHANELARIIKEIK